MSGMFKAVEDCDQSDPEDALAFVFQALPTGEEVDTDRVYCPLPPFVKRWSKFAYDAGLRFHPELARVRQKPGLAAWEACESGEVFGCDGAE